MTKTEAADFLYKLRYTVIHLRSIGVETFHPKGPFIDAGVKGVEATFAELDHVGQFVLETTLPWLFSEEKPILPGLNIILEHYGQTGELAPMDVYNMLLIAEKLEPGIAVSFVLSGGVWPFELNTGIPDWLMRWEPE